MGRQKKEKRTHSNDYSRSITIPIRWECATNNQWPLYRSLAPPPFPSFSAFFFSSLSHPLLLRFSSSSCSLFCVLHDSTCLVSSCPSFSFFCLLFLLSSLLFASLLSRRSFRSRTCLRTFTYTYVRVAYTSRDRGEGSASYVPLRSRSVLSFFEEFTTSPQWSPTSRIFLEYPNYLEYPRRASRLCTSLWQPNESNLSYIPT